ncbi:MAG: L-threonylcarbamoyladenylate synthase [Limnohabitans sp.]
MILPGQDPAAVAQAVQALSRGELLGLPTETVYGLAADALRDEAVAKIFIAKGRPADHPLIVHVASQVQVPLFASGVPDFAQRLMDAFWPGPLTLILPRLPGAATASAGGQASIGLRCPSHPVAQAVLQACVAVGMPGLSAPSANQFGRVSPTTARHVQGEFGDALLILDGGECEVGIESTIIDCTRGVPVLLRPGQVTRAQIEQVCGQSLQDKAALAEPAPKASGTLESHYAPRARVRVMDAATLQQRLRALGPHVNNLAVWSRDVLPDTGAGLIWRQQAASAATAAHDLFAVLRDLDARGVQQIWVELPPDTPEWEGVRDRLMRAAA